jgi:hypothetical protein
MRDGAKTAYILSEDGGTFYLDDRRIGRPDLDPALLVVPP